jgi:hypothetical protein
MTLPNTRSPKKNQQKNKMILFKKKIDFVKILKKKKQVNKRTTAVWEGNWTTVWGRQSPLVLAIAASLLALLYMSLQITLVSILKKKKKIDFGLKY